jgi:hypothetical protein
MPTRRTHAWTSATLLCALALALALLAAVGAQVRAATVLALDLAALVARADHVVIANAEAEHSRYRTNNRLIVTDVRLRVIESLKGSARAGDTLIATRLGGTVDEIGLSVPGEASFPSGKSAIVFLRRSEKSQELQVVGMSQGVLTISGAGAGAWVLPSGGAAELMQRDATGRLSSAAAAIERATPLRDVRAKISQLVSEAHAR